MLEESKGSVGGKERARSLRAVRSEGHWGREYNYVLNIAWHILKTEKLFI